MPRALAAEVQATQAPGQFHQPATFGDFRFMNAAQRPTPASDQAVSHQPGFSQQASNGHNGQRISDRKRSAYKPKRIPYAGARRAIALESSVKLTINLLLAVVATTTIAKLVPYYQAQRSRLVSLEESVSVAERKNAELRQEFDRNFDPAQTSRIMQEQSGMGYPNQKKVIWSEPPATKQPVAD